MSTRAMPDLQSREMYFVEVEKGTDLSKTGKGAPFYYQVCGTISLHYMIKHESCFLYQAQRQHVVCLYVVPYAVVEEVGGSLCEDLDSVMMLYSTGRCGSTLFSKVYNLLGA